MMIKRILIVGASGQLGAVLTERLTEIYGEAQIIASDLNPHPHFSGHFEPLDATNAQSLDSVVTRHRISEIYHLAAILSASGEKNPVSTWDINMKTLFNVLEVARLRQVKKVFFPSSIAVFGSEATPHHTPQTAFLNPATVYGISKAAGEAWGQYYYLKYGLDVRSLRYPGIVGYQSLPGGGTTDYAVEVYHQAVKAAPFTCFLSPHTTLPIMYMGDAIRATLSLMDAPANHIGIRTSYNVSGFSCSPHEIAEAIRVHYPDFDMLYAPDFRQKIAESWPRSIDDSAAQAHWQWQPQYDLARMTHEMITKLKDRYQAEA